MTRFQTIQKLAAKRKGGADALASLLPGPADRGDLATQSDDRVLALMTKCIFRAGFVWRIIEQKWDGFEECFLGFDPGALLFQPEEFWDDLGRDTRIVRHHAKIQAVRENALFITDISKEHGSFANFLTNWPDDDLVGLWDVLKKTRQTPRRHDRALLRPLYRQGQFYPIARCRDVPAERGVGYRRQSNVQAGPAKNSGPV